ERRIHNPEVPSSILGLATKENRSHSREYDRFFFEIRKRIRNFAPQNQSADAGGVSPVVARAGEAVDFQQYY
ncbi:hypothetical protein, partial [uncultured Duncaniella sp.]|uniref:hypothetical protein n=1 Tax=uncultured Duncaniella sp. TaxID=2768039 RepID=UPI002616010B